MSPGNLLEIRLVGFIDTLHWVSLQCFPDPVAGLRGQGQVM